MHDRVAVATLRRRDQLARQAERPSGHTPKAPQKLPVPAPCPVALRWRRTMCQIPATTATKRAIRRTSQNAPINTDNTDITRRTTSTPPATTTAAFRSGWVLGGCCWIISTSFPLGGVWPGGCVPLCARSVFWLLAVARAIRLRFYPHPSAPTQILTGHRGPRSETRASHSARGRPGPTGTVAGQNVGAAYVGHRVGQRRRLGPDLALVTRPFGVDVRPTPVFLFESTGQRLARPLACLAESPLLLGVSGRPRLLSVRCGRWALVLRSPRRVGSPW